MQKISEEDERAFENFMVKDAEKRRTLADALKEKLTEKKTEIYTVYSGLFVLIITIII